MRPAGRLAPLTFLSLTSAKKPPATSLPRDDVAQSTKSAPEEATDHAKPPLPALLSQDLSGLSETDVVQLEKVSLPAV